MSEKKELTLKDIREELKLNRLMILELFAFVKDLHHSTVPYHNAVTVGLIFDRMFKSSGLTQDDIDKVFSGLQEDYIEGWQEINKPSCDINKEIENIIEKARINGIKDPLSNVLSES